MEHFAKTETPECNATTRTNQAVISAANTKKMERFFSQAEGRPALFPIEVTSNVQ